MHKILKLNALAAPHPSSSFPAPAPPTSADSRTRPRARWPRTARARCIAWPASAAGWTPSWLTHKPPPNCWLSTAAPRSAPARRWSSLASSSSNIFAFQAENLTNRWVAVLLIAVPIIIQVYFNSSLTYMLNRVVDPETNVRGEIPRGGCVGGWGGFCCSGLSEVAVFQENYVNHENHSKPKRNGPQTCV